MNGPASLPPCATCPERHSVFCGSLDDAGLAELLALGGRRTFHRGSSLFSSGEAQGPFFKIIHGLVAVFALLPDGRRQIVALRGAGDCTGYLSTQFRYEFSGMALTDVTVCAFSRRDFDRLAQRNPTLAAEVADALSEVLSAVGRSMVMLGQLSASARVAFLLREFARQSRPGPGGRMSFTLDLTRVDIADMLGLTVETVSRSFSRLRRAGIIRLRQADMIEIVDKDRLDTLAEGQ